MSNKYREQPHSTHRADPRSGATAHQLLVGTQPRAPGAGVVGSGQYRRGQLGLPGDAAREWRALADISLAAESSGACAHTHLRGSFNETLGVRVVRIIF